MPDWEKVLTHLDDMRLFADTRVHQIVSPENWEVYSDLCDFIDLVKEEILALLKEQQEIVRCNDCIYWDKGYTEECGNLDSVCFHNGWCKPDWFCADGKRKET